FDQIRDVLDQIRFPNAGRSDQDHILFGVLGQLSPFRIFLLELAQIFRVVVMIADRDCEHLLRFVLLDDEPVEVRLDIARQKIELKLLIVALLRLFFGLGLRRLGRWKSGDRDAISEVLFHELGDLRLQLLGRRKRWWRILLHWKLRMALRSKHGRAGKSTIGTTGVNTVSRPLWESDWGDVFAAMAEHARHPDQFV